MSEAKPAPVDGRPDVPPYAERMNILAHVRHQFHPVFLNAIGGPDIYGPKHYLGIEIRCPICKVIQELGPPGREQQCRGCGFYWLYTAAKGNAWLWIWRNKMERLEIKDGADAVGSPSSSDPALGVVPVPAGDSVPAPVEDRGSAETPAKFDPNTFFKKL